MPFLRGKQGFSLQNKEEKGKQKNPKKQKK